MIENINNCCFNLQKTSIYGFGKLIHFTCLSDDFFFLNESCKLVKHKKHSHKDSKYWDIFAHIAHPEITTPPTMNN